MPTESKTVDIVFWLFGVVVSVACWIDRALHGKTRRRKRTTKNQWRQENGAGRKWTLSTNRAFHVLYARRLLLSSRYWNMFWCCCDASRQTECLYSNIGKYIWRECYVYIWRSIYTQPESIHKWNVHLNTCVSPIKYKQTGRSCYCTLPLPLPAYSLSRTTIWMKINTMNNWSVAINSQIPTSSWIVFS